MGAAPRCSAGAGREAAASPAVPGPSRTRGGLLALGSDDCSSHTPEGTRRKEGNNSNELVELVAKSRY